MKQIKHSANGRDYLLCEVERDATMFTTCFGGLRYNARFADTERGQDNGLLHEIQLPEGNWNIIGKASELSEEQAGEIVEYSNWSFPVEHKRFVDYTHPKDGKNKQDWKIGFRTPKESVASLCASHNLNRESTVILQREG